MESRLWRVAGLLPVAVVALGMTGVLLACARGEAVAMLDLTPLRTPWDLMLGLDDGAADAPLFHLLLAGATWQFGMGFGTVMMLGMCLGFAGLGIASLHDTRVSRGISVLVFLGLPFTLTRLHTGQVAFLAAVGLCLLAGTAVRSGRHVLGGGVWAVSALFAPHTVLLGLPYMMWSATRGKLRGVQKALVVAPVVIAVGPLVTAHSMLPSGVALDTALERFTSHYSTSVTGVWSAVTQQGFWAGDTTSFSALCLVAGALLATLALPSAARTKVLMAVVGGPVVVVVTSMMLGTLIPLFTPLALLREPHKLLVVPAVALAWGVGVVVHRMAGRLQLAALCLTGVLAVGGMAGALSEVTMQPATVDALEAVRATIGDDSVVVLPAVRYAHLVDVSTEVQDLVPRWMGGALMSNVAAESDAARAQLARVKRFVASGGSDATALDATGAKWVVAVRTPVDGMTWLGETQRLARRISGTIELYEVRDASACAPAECRSPHKVDAGVWQVVLLVLAMLSGPGLTFGAFVGARVSRRRRGGAAAGDITATAMDGGCTNSLSALDAGLDERSTVGLEGADIVWADDVLKEVEDEEVSDAPVAAAADEAVDTEE